MPIRGRGMARSPFTMVGFAWENIGVLMSGAGGASEDGAFDSRSVRRIVGVTARQIQYWDETGLVRPSARAAAGRGTRRLYTCGDLVRLSVVRALIERGLAPRKIKRSLAA